MKKKTKWVLGYEGDSLIYWLMASSFLNLCNQLDKLGMGIPDWKEDTGHQ